MRGATVLFALALGAGLGGASCGAERARRPVVVGSKKFTESVILGDVLAHLARSTGAAVVHERELGGTQILFQALLAGDVDAYVEYTGTLLHETFADLELAGVEELRAALARRGVAMSRPLGFENTYAMGLLRERAEELSVSRLSDLARHPTLAYGVGNEFLRRADGWPGLAERYGLDAGAARGLDHDLAYRGLLAGDIDVMDLYTTDAEIRLYDLAVLVDDRGYFPEYRAVVLHRADLAERAPDVVASFLLLEGAVSGATMIGMNFETREAGTPERAVAAAFVRDELAVEVDAEHADAAPGLWTWTLEHLFLVGVALLAAIVVAIPLGVIAALRPRVGQAVLGVVGVLQTIPSLAVLVIMIPLVGIGAPPAILALFLYGLLPIVRNTVTGIRDVPPPVRESAAALGLSRAARLRLVELPMASSAILAGVQTSAVITVGTATLGALIGAGGYGQPILTGIRRNDPGLILAGAIPAALMALAAQGAFEGLKRLVVPRGLRLGAGD